MPLQVGLKSCFVSAVWNGAPEPFFFATVLTPVEQVGLSIHVTFSTVAPILWKENFGKLLFFV